MKDYDLPAIAAELNAKADGHLIGELQEIRKNLKGLKRRPGSDIFRIEGQSKTVFPEWAFHFGGRAELQYNIGKDQSGGSMLRHGVGFSFKTSQSLPDIEVLIPKVERFNDFLQLYPEKCAEMRMWHFEPDGTRIGEYEPGPIPFERVQKGVFVFLGKRLPIEQLNYELILNDFDELLPLYLYVEGGGEAQPIPMPTKAKFAFRPGCTIKVKATKATLAQSRLDVTLRHNLLQEALYRRLASKFGADNVGTEIASGSGTSVDVVVCRSKGYWFYEIKTYQSPRACIRESLGQLLEYSFWPGAQEASRLIVVGESPLDPDGEDYLRQLTSRFSLPIHYEQLTV